MDTDLKSEFPTTNWEQLRACRTGEENQKLEVLSGFYIAYSMPLRRRLEIDLRMSRDQSEEILHAFVADRVMQQRVLERAVAHRGRFRYFVYRCLRNYCLNRFREGNSAARSPAAGLVSFNALVDSGEWDAEASREVGGEFDCLWAVETLCRSIRQMRRECREKGQDAVWEIFRLKILRPLLGFGEPVDYRECMTTFQLDKPQTFHNLLLTGKRKFRRFILAELDGPAEDSLDALSSLIDGLMALGTSPLPVALQEQIRLLVQADENHE